jgi:hypothetical protein
VLECGSQKSTATAAATYCCMQTPAVAQGSHDIAKLMGAYPAGGVAANPNGISITAQPSNAANGLEVIQAAEQYPDRYVWTAPLAASGGSLTFKQRHPGLTLAFRKCASISARRANRGTASIVACLAAQIQYLHTSLPPVAARMHMQRQPHSLSC